MHRGVKARLVNLSSQADQSSIVPDRDLSCPVNHQITNFKNHLMPFLDPVKNLSILIWNSFKHYGVLESDRSLLEVLVSQHQNFTPPSVHCTACAAWLDMVQNVYRFLTSTDSKIPVVTAIAQSYVLEAFQKWAAKSFSDVEQEMRVRQGIATCLPSSRHNVFPIYL